MVAVVAEVASVTVTLAMGPSATVFAFTPYIMQIGAATAAEQEIDLPAAVDAPVGVTAMAATLDAG